MSASFNLTLFYKDQRCINLDRDFLVYSSNKNYTFSDYSKQST